MLLQTHTNMFDWDNPIEHSGRCKIDNGAESVVYEGHSEHLKRHPPACPAKDSVIFRGKIGEQVALDAHHDDGGQLVTLLHVLQNIPLYLEEILSMSVKYRKFRYI